MGKKKNKNKKQQKENKQNKKGLPEGHHLVSLSSLISNFLMIYLEENKIGLVVEDNKANKDMNLRDFEYNIHKALDEFILELKKVPHQIVIELENENKDPE